jgi:hypothetical protein
VDLDAAEMNIAAVNGGLVGPGHSKDRKPLPTRPFPSESGSISIAPMHEMSSWRSRSLIRAARERDSSSSSLTRPIQISLVRSGHRERPKTRTGGSHAFDTPRQRCRRS